MEKYRTAEEYERALKARSKELPRPTREAELLNQARIDRAYEEIAEERRQEAIKNREPGALFGWAVKGILAFLLVILPVLAFLGYIVWSFLR